ncbi:septum formation initiator family protein [Streptomyces sp. NBC_01341]|uniref:FtsB family cell division protein n=1 Tax=Streptomyces sp. NBC_01341 TaxID=2903831 RepID=UPI002E133B51|nr:septum formation initiator family protein [Streptomyces sp. NBC_01341]
MTRTAEQGKGRAGRLARLMPSGPSTAARTPFVLLVVLLLAGGLISLLLLNSALNEGSFRLSKLKRETTELTDEQQALQRGVDSYSEPDALERRARELGMVPGGSPAFLNPDGTVRGVRERATADPSPVTVPGPAPASTESLPEPTATPSAAGSSPPPAPGSAAPTTQTPTTSPPISPGR